MSFAHLVDAIDGVLRRLGGTPRAWRTIGWRRSFTLAWGPPRRRAVADPGTPCVPSSKGAARFAAQRYAPVEHAQGHRRNDVDAPS